MKTLEEKARELYKIFDVNEFDETLKDRIIYVNAIAKREQNAYIKGHEEGKAEANAEWQEKTRWKDFEIIPKSFPLYINIKIDKCILCKKVDSLIEYYNLIYIYGFTHWREIIE